MTTEPRQLIRALIVDDEAPARARMRRMLEASAQVEIVGEAADGVSALAMVEELSPEALFLDIEMPELDGFGVAQALGGRGPRIVFVTAYDEFALKAFEASAVDYLVKPVLQARLEAALQKLRHQGSPVALDFVGKLPGRASRKFAARCGSKFIVFDPARVSAIVARDHYAGIVVDGRELLADDPLEVIAQRLAGGNFVRIHRSAMINLDFLQELEREGDRKYNAVLSDAGKTRLPISRERLPELRAELGLEGA